MPSDAGARPKRRDDLSVRSVDGEVIVLDRSLSQVHQLNATASFVWERCDSHHTAEEIAAAMLDAFEIDIDVARDAVAMALHQFDRLGLLDRARA
jgi:hypothetical protein